MAGVAWLREPCLAGQRLSVVRLTICHFGNYSQSRFCNVQTELIAYFFCTFLSSLAC